MKRALLIGIDEYDRFTSLSGCVNDVNSIFPLLAFNEDQSRNFDCLSLTSDINRITRQSFVANLINLFSPGADVALLYFSGHGCRYNNDVVLVTQDGNVRDEGIPLSQILGYVNNSSIPEIVVILDCCFSGAAGEVPQIGGSTSVLRQGFSILTSSRNDQVSEELPEGRGLFSELLCGALDGGAADVIGKINIAGIYAYLSESFSPWEQRPTFKANLDRLNSLRNCNPSISFLDLRRLMSLFPNPYDLYPLDPSYEPTSKPSHPEHEEIFLLLQRCRNSKLIEPVETEHMYYAAVNSTSCKLTPLGIHYWRMASNSLL